MVGVTLCPAKGAAASDRHALHFLAATLNVLGVLGVPHDKCGIYHLVSVTLSHLVAVTLHLARGAVHHS
jgi:NADH:ubiquinone oxidoreductase subunit K